MRLSSVHRKAVRARGSVRRRANDEVAHNNRPREAKCANGTVEADKNGRPPLRTSTLRDGQRLPRAIPSREDVLGQATRKSEGQASRLPKQRSPEIKTPLQDCRLPCLRRIVMILEKIIQCCRSLLRHFQSLLAAMPLCRPDLCYSLRIPEDVLRNDTVNHKGPVPRHFACLRQAITEGPIAHRVASTCGSFLLHLVHDVALLAHESFANGRQELFVSGRNGKGPKAACREPQDKREGHT